MEFLKEVELKIDGNPGVIAKNSWKKRGFPGGLNKISEKFLEIPSWRCNDEIDWKSRGVNP